MTDLAESTDVEFRVEESVQVQAEAGIDLVRVFAERHVGQVEQPSDFQVLGELLEVLGEMADRQSGAGRVGVDGRGGDGQEAGAVSEAMRQFSFSRAASP